jgi:hypothetical protein
VARRRSSTAPVHARPGCVRGRAASWDRRRRRGGIARPGSSRRDRGVRRLAPDARTRRDDPHVRRVRRHARPPRLDHGREGRLGRRGRTRGHHGVQRRSGARGPERPPRHPPRGAGRGLRRSDRPAPDPSCRQSGSSTHSGPGTGARRGTCAAARRTDGTSARSGDAVGCTATDPVGADGTAVTDCGGRPGVRAARCGVGVGTEPACGRPRSDGGYGWRRFRSVSSVHAADDLADRRSRRVAHCDGGAFDGRAGPGDVPHCGQRDRARRRGSDACGDAPHDTWSRRHVDVRSSRRRRDSGRRTGPGSRTRGDRRTVPGASGGTCRRAGRRRGVFVGGSRSGNGRVDRRSAWRPPDGGSSPWSVVRARGAQGVGRHPRTRRIAPRDTGYGRRLDSGARRRRNGRGCGRRQRAGHRRDCRDGRSDRAACGGRLEEGRP